MTQGLRYALVAMPVMARSGVYRSTHDLVAAARRAGHDWTAVIGMRSSAQGAPIRTEGVREITIHGRGRSGVDEVRRALAESPEVMHADAVISLISQTDVAMSGMTRRPGQSWTAWVRGMPWPAAGEQGRLRSTMLRLVESRALRRADDVWATTPVLASQFASARSAFIVPAGIPEVARVTNGEDAKAPLVWAGRVDIDKRPELFLEIARSLSVPAKIFGDGPTAAALRPVSAPNVEWVGWVDPAAMWDDASIFVGTSSREAFGRSAVEAARAGLPTVISAEYGAAPLLFTDPQLREACVISSDDPADWASAIRRLLGDRSLRMRVSDHVHMNAGKLTIEASVEHAVQRTEEIRSSII